jgi:hypothetical protein
MALPWYERALGMVARQAERIRVWHRWPFLIAVAILLGHRVNMRRHNLSDTETAPPAVAPPDFDFRAQRTADGSFNDLAKPWMGKAGTRFGRNMPIAATFGEVAPGLYDPNPRVISNELLARRHFVPVPHLNLLAAAWIQFMVHDWLSHGPGDKASKHEIPIPPGDDWQPSPMVVLRTKPDPRNPADEDRPEAYHNTESHWWDGSQIYGSSVERLRLVRTDPQTGAIRPDGKLALDADDKLPIERDAKLPDLELTGVNGNWWIGLSVLHTLFAREHNAIVDRLRIDHPDRDGEWLFQKARLVNAALMAKIHTVEWTPALMNSPEGRFAMRGNWWGLLGEHYARAYGRFGGSEILSGIPGSPTDHHAAPYAMTEEFTAVYRLHSLMPDDYSFRRRADDSETLAATLPEVAGGGVRRIYQTVSFEDVVYSLATSHPGALVLHNFPQHLRKLDKKREEGVAIDLATIDVLRDRERGVPRYCAFRRLIGAWAPRTFEELTDDLTWRRELASVYGDVEKVDLQVGVLAETKNRNGTPPGFGFSDTAFRIFILMASRRLKSDRFYTNDFTPAIYTPSGFAWIRDNSLRMVLERHCPDLRGHFADLRNVFFPWRKGGG